MYRALDVLGFAGGFTLGVVQAGFELIGKREMPGGFGVANCEANRHLLGTEWRTEVSVPDAWTPVKDVHLFFGNPPCSGFSAMTDKRHRGVDAKVNACMWAFVEFAAKMTPPIIVMESVRPAYTTGRVLMQGLRARLEELTGVQYNLYHVMQDAIELGGAAKRPRYFWVASRIPFGVDYPVVRKPILRDVWEDLEGHAYTWSAQPYRRPPTWWSYTPRKNLTAFDGHMDRCGLPTQRAMDLYEMLEEHADGWPAGWDIGRAARHCFEVTGNLPRSWNHMIEKLVNTDFHMGFTSLIRWDWERQGRVITGGALDLVIHPTQPRTITHREAARVMGFPDDWLIYPLRTSSGLRATWGKGITVQCGSWIAEHARRALDGQPSANTGKPVGDREWLIQNTR